MDRAANLVECSSLEDVSAYFDRLERRVLTFVGYYSAGYEDEAAMLDKARNVLEGHSPAEWIVNIGAMANGIGAVYAVAKAMGFETTGIVSKRAWERRHAISPCVDRVFFIEDETWGGFLPGTNELSPTSQAVVLCSEIIVAIGGNVVTRDEMIAAERLGKSIRFIPADLNHRQAIERASRTGKPPPRHFSGDAHARFAG